nr:MAG TPA: hypothetical protein [Caudoviricetes sp.]
MINRFLMESFDDKRVINEEKESNFSLESALEIGRKIASDLNLPFDKYAKLTQDNFVKAIYGACLECITEDNKFDLRFLGEKIDTALYTLYNEESNVYKKAPMEYQKELIDSIKKAFKSAYETVELKENLLVDYVKDTPAEEVYNFVVKENREDRLVPFDKFKEMLEDRGLDIMDYYMQLMTNEGINGLVADSINGDLYVGNADLLEKRKKEVAQVNKADNKQKTAQERLEKKFDSAVNGAREFLKNISYNDIDELANNVKYMSIEVPGNDKYRSVIRDIFKGDADKVTYIDLTNPNSKWNMSAVIYFKDLDKLPQQLKEVADSKGRVRSIGLAIELYRAGAPLRARG